ncbi:MAG: hypothetical protein HOP15_07145 [Planctomycetes bacterium]|nr:hypothetical protein [Planctomycetota bacterium]
MSLSPSLPESSAWSAPRRLAFRFLFVYLLAYSFPFPLSALPYGPSAVNAWSKSVWAPFVRWFGAAVVRLPEAITVLPNGSGDTTFNWVEFAAFLALGCVGALIWTALGRSASSHPRLAAFLRGYLRYVLAVAMLGYGMAKVVPQQFSAPSLDRLTSTYGESPPMGLLWTLMGASSAYQFFAGAMEVLAGLLLLTRRTAVVGALVACGVLTNVVMLNFCFDVPVKLHSSHLLLMAGLIALPDTRRLFQAVVLGREVPAANVSEVFGAPRARRVVRLATALFVISILWSETGGLRSAKTRLSVGRRSKACGASSASKGTVSRCRCSLTAPSCGGASRSRPTAGSRSGAWTTHRSAFAAKSMRPRARCSCASPAKTMSSRAT